ncbi:MAG: hypothetical protein Q8P88_01605 [Candidatus Jorgensenbacteria bacterium]|nr:hypothetical protein [Candidatus Jorgensenbacteria bacterium]
MHPLGRYAVPAGIALIVIAFMLWVLGPVVEFLGTFWFLVLLGLLIGIVTLVWRVPAAQLNAFVDVVGGNAVLRGIFIAVLFSIIYGFCLWILFGVVPGWIQGAFGFEIRWAWVLTTVLGLPLIAILWRLYSATGIPGDPKVIGKAFRGVAFLILSFFAWWYHSQPNRLFDVKTGEATFWVADKEGMIYFFTTQEDSVFSPVTGDKLRSGTRADAEKYRRESWVKEAKAMLPSLSITASRRIERVTVILKGEKVPVGPIYAPAGSEVYFIGSPTAEVEFGDGSRHNLHKEHGVRFSPFRFFGSKGDSVFVDIVH